MNDQSDNNTCAIEPSGPAQILLDVQGMYVGFLPCADCEGIETELTLSPEHTYILVRHYKGKEPLTDSMTGKFTLLNDTIQLMGIKRGEGSPFYKVEENQLKYLNVEGKEVTGKMADFYILKKEGNPAVENQRWQLVEIYGKPVKGTHEEHYLIFHAKEHRIEAKAGCNLISMPYRIKNELQLEIGQGLSTLMACPDDKEQIERKLLEVLAEANNLSIDDNTLTLNKNKMAPLARFERVK